MAKAIPQLIDGEWRGSRSRELVEVTDPATQDVLALAPKATADEIEQAIASAQRAFETWREVPAPERARLMLRYQHLLNTTTNSANCWPGRPARTSPMPRATCGAASRWSNTPPTWPA